LPIYKSAKDKISKNISESEIEKRLLLVFEKKDTYSSIIKSSYPDLFVSRKSDNVKIKKSDSNNLQVIVDNNKLMNCLLCPECKP